MIHYPTKLIRMAVLTVKLQIICAISDMAQRLSKDHYLNSEKMLCKRLKSDKVGRHYHSRRVVCPIMIRRNLTYKNTISRITAGMPEMC